MASPTCSPLRRSSAWISWALQKPGRLSSAAARACAYRIPRARVRVRTGSSGCGIVTVARYNLHPRSAQRAWPSFPSPISGRSILGAANYITAAICRLTGDQPATACTPLVRSLLPS